MFNVNSRRIPLLISLIVMTMTIGTSVMFGQTRRKQSSISSTKEIAFTNGKWKDIAVQARKNNKYIFVDAFTTWCAPCRQLKDITFKDKSAAVYFNDNFINYTVDMERGEGLELAEEWGVIAYPTLLFFTPEGKLIMKQIGYVDGKQLVEFGKQALARK
jgi:thioredoxin-related protein